MKSLIKSEAYKLYKDRQIRIVVGFIIFYLIIKFIFSNKPSFNINSTVGEWMADATIDSAFMIMLVSLVSSATFAAEYSYITYKNILSYVEKQKIFKAKLIINVIGIFAILALWYILAFVISIIKSDNPLQFQDILFAFYKFVTQYLMILAHSGFLILITIVFCNRVITNISTVLLWLSYSFIPIGGKKAFDYFVQACLWGVKPSFLFCLCLFILFCMCTFVSKIIFRIQEVRT